MELYANKNRQPAKKNGASHYVKLERAVMKEGVFFSRRESGDSLTTTHQQRIICSRF